MDAHESTTENVRTLDEPIFNFLNELYENGQLEDTIVTVYSDHGHHHSLLKLLGFQDANYENSLASLFLLLPNGRFDDEFL
jgi:arylsulfatase A-like enzyme